MNRKIVRIDSTKRIRSCIFQELFIVINNNKNQCTGTQREVLGLVGVKTKRGAYVGFPKVQGHANRPDKGGGLQGKEEEG